MLPKDWAQCKLNSEIRGIASSCVAIPYLERVLSEACFDISSSFVLANAGTERERTKQVLNNNVTILRIIIATFLTLI